MAAIGLKIENREWLRAALGAQCAKSVIATFYDWRANHELSDRRDVGLQSQSQTRTQTPEFQPTSRKPLLPSLVTNDESDDRYTGFKH